MRATTGTRPGPRRVPAGAIARSASRDPAAVIASDGPLRYPWRMSSPTSSPSSPVSAAPQGRVFAPSLFAVLGILGMAAIWTLVAVIVDRQCAWMAVLAAADLALLLRIGRAAPGLPRAFANLAATLATIAIANWCIAAAQMGSPMGLPMTESLQRIGPDLVRTLLLLATQPADLAWYAIAVVVALWLGR